MDDSGSSSLNVMEPPGEDPEPSRFRPIELRGTSLKAGGEMV